jgi:5-methylcytosine-specific restriction protein A
MGRYHVCPTPGCPNLTTGGLCEECKRAAHRARDADRPSAARRGYDAAWEARRARYLREHPICEEPGCGEPATEVDHVDGSGPRGDNSDANLRAYCKPHHSRKTVARDGGFGRPRA